KEVLRTGARTLLGELKSRRQDWALIPLALAQLEEQELADGGLDEARSRQKQELIINWYVRAIELGHRNPADVRHAVQVLLAAGPGNEALQPYNRGPVASQSAGDLGRWAAQFAVVNRDYQQAEQIARNAVAARPDDFQERIWLVRILMDSGRKADAETELRA